MNRTSSLAFVALILGGTSLSAPAHAETPVPYVAQSSWWGLRNQNGMTFPDQQLFCAHKINLFAILRTFASVNP